MTEVRQRRAVSSQQQRTEQKKTTIQSSVVMDGNVMQEEQEPFLKSAVDHEYDNKHSTVASTTAISQDSSVSDPLDGHTIVPLIQRTIFWRLDVWPFVVLYVLAVIVDRLSLDNGKPTTTTSAFLFLMLQRLFLPVLLFSHLTLALLQQWRVSVKCFVGYQRVVGVTDSNGKQTTRPPNWTHCLVTAARTGADGHAPFSTICPVTLQASRRNGRIVSVVSFQDTTFRSVYTPTTTKKAAITASNGVDDDDPDMNDIWQKYKTTPVPSTARPEASSTTYVNKTQSLFHRLRYPDTLSFAFYKSWKGHDLQSARMAHQVYGNNQTELQLPPFWDLLSEQLVAPFFLFQIFCVALWSLDEYWYYALFTLFALLMFESTVAYNRLKSLERLRGTLRHAYSVMVYRHDSWIRIMTNELVPGDLVSLSSSFAGGHYNRNQMQQQQPHPHVPADVLLLRGSGVVDESLLTGESVPQLKDAVDLNVKDEGPQQHHHQQRCLDWQENKQQILFGGTILVSHDGGTQPTGDRDDDDDKKAAASDDLSIPAPPNGGITCFVLRTGFETAQGSLIRTMAHSSKQSTDGIHTRDTFVFVLMLLVCAIFSALTVLLDGWKDETRNRFRLVLHVIIIITSVSKTRTTLKA